MNIHLYLFMIILVSINIPDIFTSVEFHSRTACQICVSQNTYPGGIPIRVLHLYLYTHTNTH